MNFDKAMACGQGKLNERPLASQRLDPDYQVQVLCFDITPR